MKELLAQNAVDFAETSRNGLPLLTLAARRRQPEICRLLIEAGCDVDQKNADGKTALHFATSVDVINLLIDAGADVEARSNDGATPVEGWVKFLHQRPAIELIKRGARFDGLDAERLGQIFTSRGLSSLCANRLRRLRRENGVALFGDGASRCFGGLDAGAWRRRFV
ncbi:MAG: ankyrin repeat domain-containing protein [Thermoguttaceae bacterium]|nr:ankyrin repeat domain-containing protein [Thermoguttaceae bacterium]